MTANVWNPGQGAIPVAQSKQTMLSEVQTAIAGQQLFTLSSFQYEPNTSSLIVAINGVVQRPTVDVAETSASSFTVDTPLKAGDIVLALGFVGITATDASLTAIANTAKGYRDSALTYSQNSSSSATAASTSATNAATSEANALSSKNAAATSATNAATSETNASNSLINAIQGMRNKIINGDMRIDQRNGGNSLTVTNNSLYSVDRWKIQTIGSTCVSQKQLFPVGTYTDSNGDISAYSRHTVTSVAAAGNITRVYQLIEGVRTFAGQTVVVSFRARADAAKYISFELAQVFGSGGTPSAAITGIATQKILLSTTFQTYSFSFTVPSIAGKTLGTNNDDYIEFNFWLEAGANFNARTVTLGQQNITFDVTNVQMEIGTVAKEFQQRPYGLELLLCQRYYEKSYYRVDTAINSSAVYGSCLVSFKATKRIVPTSIQRSGETLSNAAYNSVQLDANGASLIYNTTAAGGSATGYMIADAEI